MAIPIYRQDTPGFHGERLARSTPPKTVSDPNSTKTAAA